MLDEHGIVKGTASVSPLCSGKLLAGMSKL